MDGQTDRQAVPQVRREAVCCRVRHHIRFSKKCYYVGELDAQSCCKHNAQVTKALQELTCIPLFVKLRGCENCPCTAFVPSACFRCSNTDTTSEAIIQATAISFPPFAVHAVFTGYSRLIKHFVHTKSGSLDSRGLSILCRC